MKILVAGGAGFIGSHTCVELLAAGHQCVILDNLYNSSREAVRRIERISGKKVTFYEADILDKDAIDRILDEEKPDGCIHFAGLKAVGESVSKPIEYYHTNMTGTLNLVTSLGEHGIKNIIFSSSATVYGDAKEVPVSEETPKGTCTNPYGWTKWMQEQILTDLNVSDNEWNVVLLRYFNPIGAHESGLLGEDPKGIPNNLMPYVTRVAIGKLEKLGVFGDDYDTHDGTGVRDYIHVCDLALGHVAALKCFENKGGVNVYNLGTGVGYSVLDVVKAFEKASGAKVPYEIKPRRAGDVASLYSDATKAERELGWKAKYDLQRMCEDSYRFQKNNPNGITE